MHAYIFYLRKLSIEVHKIREKYKDLHNPKLLSKEEVSQLVRNHKTGNFKHKSSKAHVREQHKAGGIHLRLLKEVLIHKRALEYRDAMLATHKLTHQLYGNKLMHLWDRCGTHPVGPYMAFFEPNKRKNFNQIIKSHYLWTHTTINEKSHTSLFNKMERAKLCTSIINQLMNIEYMSSVDLLVDLAIPNSYFDLDGTR